MKSCANMTLRWLFKSFTERQWDNLYDKAYKYAYSHHSHLVPQAQLTNLHPETLYLAGWIEQIETDINFLSDDGT